MILDKFLAELEQLAARYYGEDWSYTFDVEDGVAISLHVPQKDDEDNDGR